VLRTEILLAEARGLDVFTLLPPRLTNQRESIAKLMESLNNSDQTYRRLAATHYFSYAGGLEQVTQQLSTTLSRYVENKAIENKIKKAGFPSESHEEVLRLITDSSFEGIDKERIQNAILTLSEGNIDYFRRCIERAKVDSRYILRG